MSLNALREAYLRAEARRWDEVVQRYREVLTSPHYKSVGAAELALRWLTVTQRTRLQVMLGNDSTYTLFDEDPRSFPGAYYPIDILEQGLHLICYQIGDDGEPGVAYYRYGVLDHEATYVSCGSDDPDAMPYFHACVDELRKTYPDALALTYERALAALEWHEKDRQDTKAAMEADDFWDADEIAAQDPTDFDRQIFQLAQDLLGSNSSPAP